MTDWVEHYKSSGLSPQTLAHNLVLQMFEPGFEPARIKAAAMAGCDLDQAVDFEDQNMLIKVVLSGRQDLLAALIDAGAAVNRQNRNGDTPLSYAAQRGECEMARTLVKAGADANLWDKWEHSPLDVAVMSRKLDVVKAVVEDNHRLTVRTLERASVTVSLEISSYIRDAIIAKQDYQANIAHGLPLQKTIVPKGRLAPKKAPARKKPGI